jgi:hypothetical protein
MYRFSNRITTGAAAGVGALFAWLISHQPAVLFSQNKPASSNQPTILFSQNKPAPAISHQPSEQAGKKEERKKYRFFKKMLTKTFWKNVGFNIFSKQMLVQLFLKNVGLTLYKNAI